MNLPQTVRLGSRGSALALWQTEHVASLLHAAFPGLTVEKVVLQTRGDRVLDTPLPLIGGKGLFTQELENALRAGEIDAAVHSLKDLPTDNPPQLTVGAVPARGDVSDVLVARRLPGPESGGPGQLPQGATIGTSSRRRAAQLLAQRPDLRIQDIRGNVDTRIRKALDPNGPYDGTVLAAAGVKRLQLEEFISSVLPLDAMLPAPGQGALGIQCRQDEDWLTLFAHIHDPDTGDAVTAERAFLAALDGGCSVPVAALATVRQGRLHVRGRVSALDGSRQIDVQMEGARQQARALGQRLAQQARQQGAHEILDLIPPQEGK